MSVEHHMVQKLHYIANILSTYKALQSTSTLSRWIDQLRTKLLCCIKSIQNYCWYILVQNWTFVSAFALLQAARTGWGPCCNPHSMDFPCWFDVFCWGTEILNKYVVKDLEHFWLYYIRKTLQTWDNCNWMLTFLTVQYKVSKIQFVHRHFAMESVPDRKLRKVVTWVSNWVLFLQA